MAQNKFLLHGDDYKLAAAELKNGTPVTVIAMRIMGKRIDAKAAPVPMFVLESAVQALAATPYQIKAEGRVIEHKATERAANMAMNRLVKAGAKNAGWELLAKI